MTLNITPRKIKQVLELFNQTRKVGRGKKRRGNKGRGVKTFSKKCKNSNLDRKTMKQRRRNEMQVGGKKDGDGSNTGDTADNNDQTNDTQSDTKKSGNGEGKKK